MRGEIYTERLVLLHSETYDKPFFDVFLNDSESTRFLPLGRVYSQKEIDDHVNERRKHWVTFGFGTYQILQKKSSNYSVGYVGAEFVGSTGYIDLRYGILKDHSQQGFVTEAVCGFLESFFLENKDIRIYGVCFKENIGSLKILQKIGMKEENVVRPYGECDLIHMSLAKEEFQTN